MNDWRYTECFIYCFDVDIIPYQKFLRLYLITNCNSSARFFVTNLQLNHIFSNFIKCLLTEHRKSSVNLKFTLGNGENRRDFVDFLFPALGIPNWLVGILGYATKWAHSNSAGIALLSFCFAGSNCYQEEEKEEQEKRFHIIKRWAS